MDNGNLLPARAEAGHRDPEPLVDCVVVARRMLLPAAHAVGRSFTVGHIPGAKGGCERLPWPSQTWSNAVEQARGAPVEDLQEVRKGGDAGEGQSSSAGRGSSGVLIVVLLGGNNEIDRDHSNPLRDACAYGQ